MNFHDGNEHSGPEAVEFENDFSALYPSKNPSSRTFSEMAKRRGLSSSLLTLIQALSDKDEQYILTTLARVPPASEADRIASSWVVNFWPCIAADISEPHLLQAVATIIDLHQQVAAGKTVGKDEWRAARQVFANALKNRATACSTAAAWVIAALAWDLNITPGALIDCFALLQPFADAKWKLDAKWTEADEELSGEVPIMAMEYALNKIGPAPWGDEPSEEDEEFLAREAILQDAFYSYYERYGQRSIERHSGTQDCLQELLEFAKSALQESIDNSLHSTLPNGI